MTALRGQRELLAHEDLGQGWGAGLTKEIRRGGERRFGAGADSPPDAPPPPVFEPPPVHAPLGGGPAAGTGMAAMGLFGALLGHPLLRQLFESLMALGVGAYDATLKEPNQSTPEISTNDLRRILADGSGFVFDTRTPLEYSLGHIPGALNVGPKQGAPMSQYVSDAAEIARLVPSTAVPIVLYCNGPFCGKSRRLGEELLAAGFSDVRRYQLGTPVWRGLVGTMAMGLEGIRYVLRGDRTAAFVDARSPEEYRAGSLPVAVNIPASEIIAAKDDGRLPMEDFNTRVVAFGRDEQQAGTLADALVGQGFNNAKFFEGTFRTLLDGVL